MFQFPLFRKLFYYMSFLTWIIPVHFIELYDIQLKATLTCFSFVSRIDFKYMYTCNSGKENARPGIFILIHKVGIHYILVIDYL